MKIAVQSSVFLPTPAKGAGAVEYLVAHLCEQLKNRGHDVTCFCLPDSTVKVKQIHAQASGSSVAKEGVLAGIMASGRFDVLFDHSLHHLAQRRKPKLPAVTMSHGMAPISLWAKNPVFTSEHHGSLHGVDKPVACRNGIDVAEIPLFDASKGPPRLVWLGRLLPYKQPNIAITIAQAAGIPLTLAGPAADQRYQKQLEASSRLPGIDYVGAISHDAVFDLLRDSVALLFTSDETEPAGIVMLEAQAAGRPVVALAGNAAPEFVGAGLIAKTQELAVQWLATGSWHAYPPTACRAYVQENHAMELMADRAEDLLVAAANGERW